MSVENFSQLSRYSYKR